MPTPKYRLGVDVGGTFTDLLLLREDDGMTWRAKVSSTPSDQSIAVLRGKERILSQIEDGGADVVLHVINHGTTVATNVILEQKGARVALIVTEGFKDILQTRRSQVPGGLASWITWKKPEPLADLELTVEAPGRIASDGTEVRAFDAMAFKNRLQTVAAQRPDAVTISLINSFANPSHELAAKRVVAEMLPNTPVSLSSEVLPEIMEYERTVTTVVNSYVAPSVSGYLSSLLEALEGKVQHLRILRSDGGLSSVKLASRFPVNWVLSGPAGGVSGAVSVVADNTAFKNLITLDMGGTSTDVSLVEAGKPRIRRETKVGDIIVKAPSVDVRTIGAGGGSIAWVPNVTKALRVGPESAGAVPGPACYGKGGAQATVTDANAVLGYLPQQLLRGELSLDLAAAEIAVQKVADEMGVSLYAAAEGILKVCNEAMFGALRQVSVEQGLDPRDFSLVAFGGAGPLHANALGKLLQAFPVIIPPSPGVLCAFGDATTCLRHEIAKTFVQNLGGSDPSEVVGAIEEMLESIQKIMIEEQGVDASKQSLTPQADLRYKGQAVNMSVEVDLQKLKKEGLPYLRSRFEEEHERQFTYRLSTNIELIGLRVIAVETSVKMPLKKLERAKEPSPSTESAISRIAMVFDEKISQNCPIWDRMGLKHGHVIPGPCIITEMDSNTVIHPGFEAKIDDVGNILIQRADEAADIAESGDPKSLDVVTVEIFESALSNARNEMDTLLTTTTMSPAIREQQDEFNVIAEPYGKMIVGQFGSFIGEFLDVWTGTIEPGDIFLTNDPYSVSGAVSHHNDWLVLMPIFAGAKLIAWTSNFGHMTDVGGSVPGSLPCAAQSIFEEGIQIPVTKIAERGLWKTDLLELIYRNVRLPEWNRCDLRALVAACELAGKRMLELYQRFGDDVYFAAIEELLSRNRKAIAFIIDSAIPDKPVSFEDYIDDDGQGVGPWKISCTMTKMEGRLNFDFSETDPQSQSSINFYLSLSMFRMFVGIYLLAVYDPSVVANDGFHDLVDVVIPSGSLLHPIRPAALSCRTHFLGRLMDVLSALLGQKAPEFMTAAGFSDSPHFMYSGYRPDGDWFQLYWIGFGGIPARPIGDGPDGHCLWPAMKAIPNEFLELYYPLRIEVCETVTDSGGPGKYRGGNGQRIFWRFLEAGEISLHDDRWLSKPWGVLGGEPGSRSSKTLVQYSVNSDSPPRVTFGSKQDRIKVSKGDVLEWVTWGGGGWGDPLDRDPEAVSLDIRRRLISRKGAQLYGVILSADLGVDRERTIALRRQLREARGKRLYNANQEIFNHGGNWQELKAKCFEETGIEPPIAPWETSLRGPMTGTSHFQDWKARHRNAAGREAVR